MNLRKKYLISITALLFSNSVFAADWGYYGQESRYSPDRWGHINSANLCGKGKKQSPINIATSEVAASDFELHKEYAGNYVEISNNGHTITSKAGRYIDIFESIEDDGSKTQHRYELIQFHFHTLSEHTVSLSPLDTPRHYDMELHLVHADKQGNLAVLGVFIQEGMYNETLGELFSNLTKATHQKKNSHSKNKQNNAEISIAKLTTDYTSLLPSESDIYIYSGSLTTPPCSENVQWMVFIEPIHMSRQQIQNYRMLFTDNGVPFHTNRPVQQLNKRLVRFGSTKEYRKD